MRAVTLGIVLLLFTALQAQKPEEKTQTQQRPVFRAGAHYVRVDAYPTAKNGEIVTGLTKDDFEVYEDGKLQDLERAEFVTFDTWTPEGERKDPRTQQDAYDLAADPNYRVFVIVLDRRSYDMHGQHYLRGPLHEFLERNLGPRDLFGLLSTESEWTDLVLGQTTTAANAVLDSKEWLDPDRVEEKYWPYFECGIGPMVGRKRLEDTYALLEGLVKLLSAIRQERKGIVFVTNGLAQPGTINATTAMSGMPDVPRIGGVGRGTGELSPKGDRVGGGQQSSASWCNAERMRLAGIDFTERFRDLLKEARQGNVAFYPVSPLGLQTMPFKPEGGVDLQAWHRLTHVNDDLITLANETDGVAIVNTSEFSAGMRRISADMHAYYVLGYYTNNTKWDGGVRSIKVRLKPKHDAIRARKQYRAPTMQEIAALSVPPARGLSAEEKAFGELSRPESSAVVSPDGPFLYRNGVPAARFVCARTDKVRVEWTAPPGQISLSARLLDRHGQPLPVPLAVRDNETAASHRVIVEFSLAPLARGDYLVELASPVAADRRLVALRVE